MRARHFSAIDYIPEVFRDFLRRRFAEFSGILLLALSAAIALSLATWSVQDPSLNHAVNGPVRNLLGRPGAVVADLIMQLTGLAAIVLLLPPSFWGLQLVSQRRLEKLRGRIGLWLLGTVAASGFASLLPATDRWPLPSGLGGVVGDAILVLPRKLAMGSGLVFAVVAIALMIAAILMLSAAAGVRLHKEEPSSDPEPHGAATVLAEDRTARDLEGEDLAGEPGLGLVSVGAIIHLILSARASLSRWLKTRRKPPGAGSGPAVPRAPWFDSPGLADPTEPGDTGHRLTGQGERPSEHPKTADLEARAVPIVDSIEDAFNEGRSRVTPGQAALKCGKRVLREAQPSFLDRSDYQLPPLLMLTEAKKNVISRISEDALEQNARLLEGVLDDFGVKGEIINVRPGPVVTLYELEPAPGIKSSRVIGLADDIARSMSAVSARVAVVQGRNAIGIELPNQRRETVYLRELLACEDFEKSKHKLTIALGKTIGGEPVIVDLAKMPHLLVAGTTGSGKSVAINTMILSLLYRLRPEECRLIMVDPKMLELSVYDGIPHLLTPVVTDPKKAVVALKWAVREMEDRYKKMSKLGVRNIDGFNARVSEAAGKGETIKRIVQIGYDRETGEAIYEQEEMDLALVPYIVVIVDEMADLMMVAGKDIEGAIQRLAQMARAAGIHLIMATQRPSVDVITGTIKANFPTRISFQVTSKIDSRTILGEQGAEQLLGQGDMLYMAGGGRISRVHGPFVSDSEVEKIVAHLKAQGKPEYLEAITVEDEVADSEGEELLPRASMDAEESTDLYDRAVAIVLRDRKCSTSYIQRRLSVGYNKAASLVERMEKEGVVGPANHAGKREILVGGGVDRGAFEVSGED
jgi:DNA segregation ATPase FtsK/SpoIIIE, S-DNA-T family